AEGESDDRRYRRERDVALVEIEFDADDFTTLPDPAAYDARIRDRCGIGARTRTCQREAGYFLAPCEARQVVVFLFLRAVVIQQLGGTQRVGYGDCGRSCGAAAPEFHPHPRGG